MSEVPLHNHEQLQCFLELALPEPSASTQGDLGRVHVPLAGAVEGWGWRTRCTFTSKPGAAIDTLISICRGENRVGASEE